jgi:hypothetical protein
MTAHLLALPGAEIKNHSAPLVQDASPTGRMRALSPQGDKPVWYAREERNDTIDTDQVGLATGV